MTMQHTHLTAWQHHAPWPKRSQLEQDLRLSHGVAAIFGDDVLREHLAMRGGTVLHKAHLAPAARYSEDIDLVLVKVMATDTLERHLNRVLIPVLGRASESLIADAWLAMRNVLSPSKILRMAYRFVPLGLQREETIKVEVNLNESASLYPWGCSRSYLKIVSTAKKPQKSAQTQGNSLDKVPIGSIIDACLKNRSTIHRRL